MYALEPGVRYVARALTSVAALRERYENRPTDGSPLAKELGQLEGRRRQHVIDATSVASSRMVAAEEHLRAMTTLIPDRGTLYSTYTLARTVAEMSARAWWLLDPTIGGDNRAQRGLAERRYSHNAVRGLRIDRVSSDAATKLRELDRKASSEGLTVRKPNRRPDADKLLDRLFGEDKLGPTVYSLLSAFSHGTEYALYQLVLHDTVRDTAEGGVVEVQLGTAAHTEAQVMLIALVPWRDALAYQCRLYGWDARHIEAELIYGAAELRRVMWTSHPGPG